MPDLYTYEVEVRFTPYDPAPKDWDIDRINTAHLLIEALDEDDAEDRAAQLMNLTMGDQIHVDLVMCLGVTQ